MFIVLLLLIFDICVQTKEETPLFILVTTIQRLASKYYRNFNDFFKYLLQHGGDLGIPLKTINNQTGEVIIRTCWDVLKGDFFKLITSLSM